MAPKVTDVQFAGCEVHSDRSAVHMYFISLKGGKNWFYHEYGPPRASFEYSFVINAERPYRETIRSVTIGKGTLNKPRGSHTIRLKPRFRIPSTC